VIVAYLLTSVYLTALIKRGLSVFWTFLKSEADSLRFYFWFHRGIACNIGDSVVVLFADV